MTEEKLALIDGAEVKGVKFIAIGSIMAEYGSLLLKDRAKFDLKQRVGILRKQSQNVQNWFILNEQTDSKKNEAMRSEFSKSEIYLMGEILNLISYFTEDTLEEILEQLKKV
jgi:hypothetical protein